MNVNKRIDELLEQGWEFTEIIEAVMREYGFSYENAVLIYEEEH